MSGVCDVTGGEPAVGALCADVDLGVDVGRAPGVVAGKDGLDRETDVDRGVLGRLAGQGADDGDLELQRDADLPADAVLADLVQGDIERAVLLLGGQRARLGAVGDVVIAVRGPGKEPLS
jgi:hypothetical protein